MRPDYRLKRTIPREFVVLKPEQYKVRSVIANILKAYVSLSGQNVIFRLSKNGNFFINDTRSRRNDKGEFVIYAIPAERITG